MSEHSNKKTFRIEGGAQIEWEFEPDDTSRCEDSLPRYASTPRALLFDDRDPRQLFVGGMRLHQYLEQRGLTDVLEFRRLLAMVDWSPFESRYAPGGRPPFHPRTIVGLVLFGITNGKSSLRELELLAASDVRCWWLTGGLCPDHSAIGKFLNRHQEHLTEAFFEELTRKILHVTGSDSSRVANDGTVIEAMSSRMRKLQKESAEQAAREAEAQAKENPEDRGLYREAERARREAEAVNRRIEASAKYDQKRKDVTTCPTDPDAAINQTKRHKSYKPSYVASVLANEDRIITAQNVDPTSEIAVVKPLIEQSERTSGQKVEELLQDGGYFCTVMAALCMTEDINWLCPSGRVEQNAKPKELTKKKFLKEAFRYDEERDQYVCPAGQVLAFETKSEDKPHRKGYRRYRCKRCGGCSYREQCTKDPKGRSIKRFAEDDLMEAEREVMKHPKARSRYRQRKGMVEPVFGEQRYIQGLHRFRRRGLARVKLEYAMHSAAHNVRRYLFLTSSGDRRACESAGNRPENLGSEAILPTSLIVWAVAQPFRCEPPWWLVVNSSAANRDAYHAAHAA